jgi:hypothetical protein
VARGCGGAASGEVRPKASLAYEHMFSRLPSETPSAPSASLRRRVARAAGLARAFLLLEDDSLDDVSDPHELPGGLTPHPHRSPLRAPRRSRRPGAGLPRPVRCISPVRAQLPARRLVGVQADERAARRRPVV